jgi:Pyruvate/2-oxoacid:ferredoxin oxidoreductase gamma subunit
LILSFELLETLRALCKANKKTLVISSTEKIMPLSVSTQKLKYPTLEEIAAQARKVAKDFVPIEARRLAEESAVSLSSNLVMVGALAGTGITGIDRRCFEKAIEMNVSRSVPENLKAFEKGFQTTANSSRK